MKQISPLLRLLVAAGASLTACSDGGLPIQPVAPRASGPASLGRSNDDVGAQTFTSIDFPGAVSTFAIAINSRGEVVGRYLKDGQTHGFLRSRTGDLSSIDYPGAAFTVVAGINRRGDIVGHYALPGALNRRHGYLLRDGVFTSFDPPGSNWTNVLGINDRGLITGRYCTLNVCRRTGLGDFHGFKLSEGEFTTIDVPGSRGTSTGICSAAERDENEDSD